MTTMTPLPDEGVFPEVELGDRERAVLRALVREPAAIDGRRAEVVLRTLAEVAGLSSAARCATWCARSPGGW